MDRLGATGGNVHQLVLAQIGAGAFPEGLPGSPRLDEAVLGGQFFEPRDRHVAKAREHRLDKVAGRVLDHRGHAVRIGAVDDEDVVLRRRQQRFARGVEREMMPLTVAEIDGDAAIEVVEIDDRSQSPGRAQHQCTLVEPEQPLQPAQRLVERTRLEPDGIDEGQLQAILRRLAQRIAHGGSLQPLAQRRPTRPHQLERRGEVLRLGERRQRQRRPLVGLGRRNVVNQRDHLFYRIRRLLQIFGELVLFLFGSLFFHCFKPPFCG